MKRTVSILTSSLLCASALAGTQSVAEAATPTDAAAAGVVGATGVAPPLSSKRVVKRKKKLRHPMKFVSSSRPGPGIGETTIRWKEVKTRGRTRTTGFRIETSLTQFSPYRSPLPRKGRHWHAFHVGKDKRKLVLGPGRLAAVGAPLASANHVYFRVWSIHKRGKRKVTRSDGRLGVAVVKGMPSTGQGTGLRVMQYNIRDAGLDSAGSPHAWSRRMPLVVQNILGQRPDLVTLAEDSAFPARDQAVPLLRALQAGQPAGTSYRMADIQVGRPDEKNNGNGNRIIYDSNKFTELPSPCVPANKCVSESPRRFSYTHFQDNSTKKKFWVMSFHLATGHANSRTYNRLRLAEIRAGVEELQGFNTDHEPVILGGDMNDYQNSQGPEAFSCHDWLVGHGFYDTAAAVDRKNLQYPTTNHFKPLRRAPGGVAPRLDAILTWGMQGADSFTNVIDRPGGEWPSDHDPVVATFNLP